MNFLSLNQVGKKFDTFEAIKNFSLDIKPEEFIVFVGPSGCGKSTLLRLIAGLEKVDSGSISLMGEDITDVPPSKRDLAMVFQSYALYPHMSVAENMGFSLRLAKVPKKKIEEKVLQAAKVLNLLPYLKRKPKELSGGQRQRVAIGRAIVRQPKLFLFDEPLSNLDAALRSQTRIEIAKLHKNLKVTTIYVTHDQVEAMTLADRVVILNHGKVEQVGTPLELYDSPADEFVAQFIGTPKMNLIEIENLPQVLRKSISTFLSKKNKALEAAAVKIGFRPDMVEIDKKKSKDSIETKVILIENLGTETLVYLKTDNDQEFVLRTSERLNKEKKLRVRFILEKMHFFDAQGKIIKVKSSK